MKRFLILFVSLIFATTFFAQNNCSLTSFSYEVKLDGSVFYISINDPIDIHENYSVYVNQELQEFDGVNFGPFEANCQTFYSLLVVQNNADACNVQANIGTICPQTDICRIGEIEFSYPECNPNGVVLVDLDFKYENVSDSFSVKGNGTYYGDFSYADLPISVGPIVADCDKEFEFVVQDLGEQGCKSVVDDIRICCPTNCHPPVFEIVEMTCTEDELSMKLKLVNDVFNTNLQIKINEEYIQNFEVDLPYIYLKSPLPLNIVLHTVSVCTVGIADVCCYSQEFSTDNCSPSTDCKIYDLHYEITDCQENDEIFVSLDFEYKNVVSDTFVVKGNGINYGMFSYNDLPVKIGPFESACDVVYELKVYDSEENSCSAAIENLIVCCPSGCLEPIFEIVSVECSDTKMEIKVELVHPLNSDGLLVLINNHIIDDYELNYPYLYIRAENPGSLVNELTICNHQFNGTECCYSHLFDLNCNPNDECEIGTIKIEATDCFDTDLPGLFINFDHKNTGSKGFSVKGNGNDYGDFQYDDLPIFINVMEDCTQFYEFVVIDNEFECSNFVEYGPYCCSDDCSFRINNPRIRCEDGVITEVAFHLDETTDPIKNYAVYINGQLIGETMENNVFLEFPTEIPIHAGDAFELVVCDEECCVTTKLDLSDCAIPPQDCEISNVQTSSISCGNGSINFVLDFDHVGTQSDKFDVFSIFGFFGTYEYAQLPLKIENYPSVNLGLNVLFVCDKGSFCCQAHLFTAPLCLNADDGLSNVDDYISKANHRYIRQNPAKAELVLDSPYENTTYQILDNSGKLIKTVKSISLESREDISDLRAGLYIVRIENKGEIKIEKLIITN